MSSDVGVIPTHSFGREWVLFVAVGLGVTATNVLMYLAGVYIAGLRPSIAAGIAFILLVPIHFYSYSKIVFRSGSTSFKMIFCYSMTLAVSFLLNVGLVDFYWGVLLAEPISALGACAVGRFSSRRMIRDRGNFVLTTVVPDIGMGNRRSASPRGVIRSPIGSMAVPNRRHRTPIPVTRSPQALASA